MADQRGNKAEQILGPRQAKPRPVALEKWAVVFITDDQLGGKAASCLGCHMMYRNQKTCAIIGPDIAIDVVKKNGKLYTPVCGEQDPGDPMDVPDSEVVYLSSWLGPSKADGIGLEWAEGTGTNCGGKYGGAKCTSHYTPIDKKEGFCRPLQTEVYAGDCCAAHKGPSLPWREAQKILKRESGDEK